MTKAIKTLGVAILFACMAIVNSTPAEAGMHPDGPATIYRAWGPTVPTQDGYACTLFDSFGVQVGSVQFHADGRADVTIGTEQAHFIGQTMGLAAFHPLDTFGFPDIPKQYRKDGYRLMTYSARMAVGENMSVASPSTSLAQSISVVEVRCVYIVDSAGNIVFCLNCLFVVS
jgi:hypothetical protein